ncbi:type II toxin-antitoxin system prevent-host-death family antitoxin [Laribacter hongkongensis]|uniref:type II toxin-antitoxin system Phd/YefM family antitoxin n=1 Tax=Laribacter hongkongensis TaxID=168471 RepID=UPI001EFC4F30|nr:type II toxin-antitoxin system prevent-host-death family antitoxin [Laribacter hongkongensis]MCG8990882.1 type II toxin-antitoxin system prevent-host-death family antitoxin [Laribacter hongkongensis]MCG8997050.1 type II toxin-antitoxin system prevent-host-death family antitoxin [Laribacter hongkongensis]MCG9001872.1 type II toxin-antitoxin system prevent-host-death family antitoxin [Laribacter hongkongensis]MCG9003541.1 type II toxin-antitoxin system prevent-host-death family antitoxin [Lari
MHAIHADVTVSVTELKRSPSAIIEQAGNNPVAILNHNRPAAYLLSAELFESILDRLEDAQDVKLARERANGPFVEVNLDDL